MSNETRLRALEKRRVRQQTKNLIIIKGMRTDGKCQGNNGETYSLEELEAMDDRNILVLDIVFKGKENNESYDLTEADFPLATV